VFVARQTSSLWSLYSERLVLSPSSTPSMDPEYEEYKDSSKFKSYVSDFSSSLTLFEKAKEWADLIKCLQRVTSVCLASIPSDSSPFSMCSDVSHVFHDKSFTCLPLHAQVIDLAALC